MGCLRDVGGGGVQAQAGVHHGHLRLGVDQLHGLEVLQEGGLELARLSVLGAELGLQLAPGDGGGALERGHPVGEPDVEVHAHGGAAQGCQGGGEDRDGGAHDLLEVGLAELDARVVGPTLVRELVAVGHVHVLAAEGAPVGRLAAGLDDDRGRAEPVELVHHTALIRPGGVGADAGEERAQGGAGVQVAGAGAHGLGGHPGEQGAGQDAEGEASRAGGERQGGVSVASAPVGDRGSGVAVGQAQLGPDAGGEGDLAGVLLDLLAELEQPQAPGREGRARGRVDGGDVRRVVHG